MEPTFFIALFIFILFVSFVLISVINYFVYVPQSNIVIELREKSKSMFNLFFGTGGIVTNERVSVNLLRVPLLLDETNTSNRTHEVITAAVDFDEDCNQKSSWNNTIRVYDQQFSELPSRISYQEFCTSQWLNRTIVTFITNISSNEKKVVYVYSINNTNTTPPNYNLPITGYWTFDEAGGTLAKDFSGYQNNGTLTGFDFNGRSGWHNGTDCRYSSCLKFDGADDYVNVGDVFDFAGNASFSVSFWIKPNTTSPSDYFRIISKEVGSGTREGWLIFQTQTTGTISFERYENNAADGAVSTTVPPTNSFTSVITTYNGSRMILYINGVQEAITNSTKSISNHANPFRIGSRSDAVTQLFNGTIDDARIYNRTLTTAEITTIANATLITPKVFTAENVTAISAEKVQNLQNRSYDELRAIAGEGFDFRIEIREKK
ncbi:MAG: LamG domain-containing protein [Candidatus Aenigmarchaeota archaeon]|nr:LamG domain-containing protein [Candidatus Aenigmarchaeota archaeon]